VVGGQRFFEGSEGLPINPPPALSIPIDFIRGVGSGDLQLVGDAFSRMVPAGIAAQRLAGVLPHFPKGPAMMAELPSSLQRTYADWGKVNQMGVPVYKATGELIDYQNPVALVMKGLGVNLQSHKKGSDFDRWLTSQRDKILDMRRSALNAMLANNVGQAQRIQASFKRQFGFPLTVSKAQVRARMRAAGVPRTERMLDHLPKEARAFYLREAMSQSKRLGMAPEDLLRGATVSQRDLDRPSPVRLDPATVQFLQQQMEEAERVREVVEGRYDAWQGYGK
jgi:hypothetical protein